VRYRKKRRSGRSGPAGIRCVPHQKEAFRSRAAAVNALARYATRPSGDKSYYPRRAYPGSCGYWHLTRSL